MKLLKQLLLKSLGKVLKLAVRVDKKNKTTARTNIFRNFIFS